MADVRTEPLETPRARKISPVRIVFMHGLRVWEPEMRSHALAPPCINVTCVQMTCIYQFLPVRLLSFIRKKNERSHWNYYHFVSAL